MTVHATKFCRGCSRDLPSSSFCVNRRNANGLQARCRECYSAVRAKNYAIHKDGVHNTVSLCPDCGASKSRQAARCAPCANGQIVRVVGDKHPQWRGGRPKNLYGLTAEEVLDLHAEQGGKCAICGEQETVRDWQGGKTRALSIDHDHETGAVRGLLCYRCNNALGLYQDDPALLERAASYLRSHSENNKEAAAKAV